MAELLNKTDIFYEDTNTLCLKLFNHSQWTSYREFNSGSYAEIPFSRAILDKFKLDKDALDADTMKYVTSVYAFSRGTNLSHASTYYGDVLRIFTDDVHTGYARLIYEKDNVELRTDRVYRLRYGETRHGPAVKTNNIDHLIRHQTKYRYDKSFCVDYKNKFFLYNRDHVFAVHSPYWPIEAGEWVNRRRFHGCPTRSTIKQVLRNGCDFVQVSHNRHFNDGEWRFSFSKAELLLLQNFTHEQRVAYRALWLIYKMAASKRSFTGLCTYFFKTLMLWSCEEKSREFWSENCLAQSIRELLVEMTMWLMSKSGRNYFIPGNNMMDHLIHTDLSADIATLFEITSEQMREISDIVADCQARELLFRFSAYRIDLPTWLKRAIVLRHSLRNPQDSFTEIFSKNLITDLQRALRVELSDVFKGINFHRLADDCTLTAFEHGSLIGRAIEHFTLATKLVQSQEREWLADPDWVYMNSVVGKFLSRDSDLLRAGENTKSLQDIERSSANTMLDSFDNDCRKMANKYLLYHRSFKNLTDEITISNCRNERMTQGTAVSIAIYWIFENETITSTDVETYKEWPGISPTVNISWFIAKAYLANLYYTTNSDVSLTIKTCDDVIDAGMMSSSNEEFAEDTFPVVLCTEWSKIYDKEVQSLLGFYSLCSSVLDRSGSRSVYLGVCPVQFALYVKWRTLSVVLREEYVNASDMENYNRCGFAYNDHEDDCGCDEYVNNGKRLIRIALGKCNCKKCCKRAW